MIAICFLQIAPNASPSCDFLQQADNHSLSLSSQIFSAGEAVQTKRSRDAPKGSRHVMTELAPGEMLKKSTFMQKQGSMNHRQVEENERKKKMPWQSDWLVTGIT